MSIRGYSEINLHITWHTKANQPMIDPSMQPNFYAYIKNRVVETRGAYFHVIGGIADYLHLAVSVKPSVHLDEWIGQLKGASSHEMGEGLRWQHGYGIVSFGTKDLKWVKNYILNQEAHHRNGTFHERLETVVDDDEDFAQFARA